MFRKSLILTALAATLAAGSAFAADHVTGKVTRVDTATGAVWLDNGVKFTLGTELAAGLLPGNDVSITYTDYNNSIDVLSASPAS